jgi:hypothetical protein
LVKDENDDLIEDFRDIIDDKFSQGLNINRANELEQTESRELILVLSMLKLLLRS